MRSLTSSLATAALAVLGIVPLFAQGGANIGARPSAAGTHAATGVITRFDAGTRVVTLATNSGRETFKLGDRTRVIHGGRVVTDIGAFVGHKARVHYVEVNGARTAASMSIAGKVQEPSKPTG